MISKELSSYIKFLSTRDTKNLSQKGLKAAEEVGELAKKILPYENAFATNHRIVTKAQILEEVADVMLCVLSIANDVGASDEDVEAMLARKASIWAEKQDAEIGLSYPLPYEIHVTVMMEDSRIEEFKRVCKEIGVKAIVIDLENNNGEAVMRDVMTSSKHFGDNTSVLTEVERITKSLSFYHFRVVREKVETVPWHPAAPRRNNKQEMPKDCYFECHFAVVCDGEGDNHRLGTLAYGCDLHKSRNIFKKYDDGHYVVMLTSRAYDGSYEDFSENVSNIKDTFTRSGFVVEKVIVEFSIFDTKMTHDNIWISKNEHARIEPTPV